MRRVAFLLLALSCLTTIEAVDNGLGRLPPLGWNTWCTQGHCGRDYCDATEVLEIADEMATNGMQKLGFRYVNLDDCWGYPRDQAGHYRADPDRFPPAKDGTPGMKVVADQLHAKGFLYGLYTDGGTTTCSRGERPFDIPGSYGHFEDDAATFASWGMDYIKMDWCSHGTERPEDAYRNMSMALNATGRDMYFLTCEWGVDDPWQWMRHYANAWRATGDHHDDWNNTAGVIEQVANLADFAGCRSDGYGCGWNYMDFLMTGGQGCDDGIAGHRCPGMMDTEYLTEATIWTIAASPLIVATDLRNMSAIQRKVLLNEELIAIHQDKLGKAGGRVSTDGAPQRQVWSRDLHDASKAVALYNADDVAHNITLNFHVLGWPNSKVDVRDVWEHTDKGTFGDSFVAEVAPHGVFFGRLKCLDGSCE